MQIEDRYASSIHARVFERGGRFFVEDMNSTNGTLLNGATLKGEAELIDGDTVQIGDTEFRLEVVDDAADRRAGRRAPTPAASATPTRTRSSSARRCSSSPTGWAAPRPARSPPKPPPSRSTASCRRRRRSGSWSETIEAANRTIHELARKDPGLAGMGTTITAAIVDPEAEEVAIGHVGDSRAYRLRGGKFERLTRDHSLVEEMRRKGQLTDAQAEDHPQRSIITRALGPEPEVKVDVQTVPAQAGDVFLICSDGLTTMLDDEHIARLLARASSMEAAVRALVDEANRAGGRDNITVVAFRLEDAAAPAGNPRRPDEGATLIGATPRRPA